jgi:hypothetical protein
MSSGLSAVAGSVATTTNAAINVQETTTDEVIQFVGHVLPLYASFLTLLLRDHWQYFIDTTAIPNDHRMAGVSAADYAKYTQDSADMTTATGTWNALIANEESILQNQTGAVKTAYHSFNTVSLIPDTVYELNSR